MAEQEWAKQDTPPVVVRPGWLQPVLLHEWLAQPDPTVRWLIEGLLPSESLVMISGPRKRAFKTWLAMLLAGMVAGGVSYDTWKTVSAVPTLFIEEESTTWSTKDRMRKILLGLGLPMAALESALAAPFYMAHRTGFKVDNPRQLLDLCSWIATNGIKLVFLDALTFMHRGDANNERDMQAIVLGLFELRRAGATVCWLSHTNKEGDKVDHDPDLDVRGSSVILDAYDAHLAVRRKKKGLLSVTARYKEAEEREFEFYWHFPPANQMGPVRLEITHVTEAKKQGDIVQRFRDAGWLPGVTYDALAFRAATGLSSGACAELRAKLVSEGKLILAPDGRGIRLPQEGSSNG